MNELEEAIRKTEFHKEFYHKVIEAYLDKIGKREEASAYSIPEMTKDIIKFINEA